MARSHRKRKENKVLYGIVKMVESNFDKNIKKYNESARSPWGRPDSACNWDGKFSDTLKAVSYH